MSREIVIRDVYAVLMSDDDWDGTTSASVDEVLDMYGYGPENPGHGIIGQISDVLYTAEDWNRATTNAIALTLAEDSDRRRLEALGPMVRNGSPLASDALADHLEENPPGGMVEFEEEDYEENPVVARSRGRGRRQELSDVIEVGDRVMYRIPGQGLKQYSGTVKEVLDDGVEVINRFGELEEVPTERLHEVRRGSKKFEVGPMIWSMRSAAGKGRPLTKKEREAAERPTKRARMLQSRGIGEEPAKRGTGVVRRRR